jgi:hypothetical protein
MRMIASTDMSPAVADPADDLGVAEEQHELFSSFFTPQPPVRRAPNFQGDGVRVRYLGHASVLIQSSTTSILVDSFFASMRDEDAAPLTLTQAVKPKRTYVYAMGQEPWMAFLMGLAYTAQSVQIAESNKFIARCVAAGIPSAHLFGCKELPEPKEWLN